MCQLKKIYLRAFGVLRCVRRIRNYLANGQNCCVSPPDRYNANDKYNELYDGRVACTHRSFAVKNTSLDNQLGIGTKYDDSVRRGLRAPAGWSGDPHGRQTQNDGLQVYDAVAIQTNNKLKPGRATKRTLIFSLFCYFYVLERRRASPDHMSGTDAQITERRARSAQTALELTHCCIQNNDSRLVKRPEERCSNFVVFAIQHETFTWY